MAGILTGDRTVRLEVSGVCQQPVARRSNYTITVPYHSMSKTMQNISRMGGKIVGIQVGNAQVRPGNKPSAPAESSQPPEKAEAPAKSKSKKSR
jgi:hypothetical protein